MEIKKKRNSFALVSLVTMKRNKLRSYSNTSLFGCLANIAHSEKEEAVLLFFFFFTQHVELLTSQKENTFSVRTNTVSWESTS